MAKLAVAATALPAIGCFKGVDLVALAEAAEASGKPAMTPANMNTALPLPGQSAFGASLKEFSADPGRYLADRFTLTPIQVDGLRRLSPQDRKVLSAAVDESIRTRKPLHIALSQVKPPKDGPPFRLGMRTTPDGVDLVVDTEAWGE